MTSIRCPVCSAELSVKTAEGRRSHKPFIMLVCDKDPRHFRGFITDQEYIRSVLDRATTGESAKDKVRGRGEGRGRE